MHFMSEVRYTPNSQCADKYNRIKEFIAYYNYRRPHQGLSMSLPAMKYSVAA